MKLNPFYTLILGPQVLAVPATPIKRYENLWPAFCDFSGLRGPGMISGKSWLIETGGTFKPARAMRIRLDMGYRPMDNNRNELSVPAWIAQYRGADFDWRCDSASCDTDYENFYSECQKDQINGDIAIVLESASNLYKYLISLNNTITNQAQIIESRLPFIFNRFGVEIKMESDENQWETIIGVVAGGVGIMASIIPKTAASTASTAVELAATIAEFLLPKLKEEKLFKWHDSLSSSFGDNVQIMQRSINDYLKEQFLDPTSDIKAFNNNKGNFLSLIESGQFAENSPTKLVEITDENILAGLAAPLINNLWKDTSVMVIKFDGPGYSKWLGEGKLCGDDGPFKDLQPDGPICDDEGSLYMIMRFGITGNGGDSTTPEEYVRDFEGMEDLVDYGINRRQIIDGSIANQNVGGYLYNPSPEDLISRLRGVKSADQLQLGALNVWNLPFCYSPVPDDHPEDLPFGLDNYLAIRANRGCRLQKDQNNKDWPYKNAWGGDSLPNGG